MFGIRQTSDYLNIVIIISHESNVQLVQTLRQTIENDLGYAYVNFQNDWSCFKLVIRKSVFLNVLSNLMKKSLPSDYDVLLIFFQIGKIKNSEY